MVPIPGRIFLAAEHLLDVYFTFRFLLAFGKASNKKRACGFWGGSARHGGYGAVHARRTDFVRRADAAWLLHAVNGAAGKTAGAGGALGGMPGWDSAVFVVQGYQ